MTSKLDNIKLGIRLTHTLLVLNSFTNKEEIINMAELLCANAQLSNEFDNDAKAAYRYMLNNVNIMTYEEMMEMKKKLP